MLNNKVYIPFKITPHWNNTTNELPTQFRNASGQGCERDSLSRYKANESGQLICTYSGVIKVQSALVLSLQFHTLF